MCTAGKIARWEGSRRWLVCVRRVEQLHFLEVHLRLQLAQDDVVDEILVPQRGDFLALVVEHAKTHPPHQILALGQVVVARTVVVRQDEPGVFFVFPLDSAQQLRADTEGTGDRWQGVKGGLTTPSASQLQFLLVGAVVGHPRPADDGGQGGPLDYDGQENDDDHDEDDQAPVGERLAAMGGQGNGQRCSERYRAAESCVRGNHALTPADATVALYLATVYQAKDRGGGFSPEKPGNDDDTGDGESHDHGVAKSPVDVIDTPHGTRDLDSHEHPQRAVE